MHVLRTPDDRFDDLRGYDFEPHDTEVPGPELGSLRVHHCAAGPADGNFLQEDKGEELARAVVDLIAANP